MSGIEITKLPQREVNTAIAEAAVEPRNALVMYTELATEQITGT